MSDAERPPAPNFWCHKCNDTIHVPTPDGDAIPQCPKCSDYFVEKYTPPPDLPAFRDSRQYRAAARAAAPSSSNSGGAAAGAAASAAASSGLQGLVDLHMAQLARASANSEGDPLRGVFMHRQASGAANPGPRPAPASTSASAARDDAEEEDEEDPHAVAIRTLRELIHGSMGGMTMGMGMGGMGGAPFNAMGGSDEDEEEDDAEEEYGDAGLHFSMVQHMTGNPMQAFLETVQRSQANGSFVSFLSGINPAFANMGDYASDAQLNDIMQQMLHQDNGQGPPPLSQAKLDALEKQTLPAGHSDVGKECPVCQENFEEGSTVCSLPCKHAFHEGCIKPWLAQRCTCPLCRFDVEKMKAAE